MRDSFIDSVHKVTAENGNVLVLVGDIGAFLYRFYIKDFPNNFYNMGIAEAHMTGAAAGLAQSGKIPFVYSITPFVTARNYEQIKVDVCYSESNVKFVGVGSGIGYSTMGSTHHALEDIALMSSLPGMMVFSPSEPAEVDEITKFAAGHVGPVYIRLGSNIKPIEYKKSKFVPGKARLVKNGDDVALLATGDMVPHALQVHSLLSKKGINSYVVNFHTIKPIDSKLIRELAKSCKVIVSLEDHSTIGGFGSAVSAVMAQTPGAQAVLKIMGFEDEFCKGYSKSPMELYEKYGLSPKDITKEIIKLYKKQK